MITLTPEEWSYAFLLGWTVMFLVLFVFWAGYARGRYRALKDQIKRKKESLDSFKHF